MKTILVVDDNKLNLAAARKVLCDTYKVIPVMRGAQALTYLENGECDIILLDINMPEMDGFEVLEKIKAMEQCKNIPVIFLTADNDTETETRCF
ncbi:MAG: PleD family two-component system response regulator, partial [Oscillospiraceae bacterium]